MFAVLRILFIILVLVASWAGYRYLTTRETRWLRILRGLLIIVIVILLVFFLGLAAERLFWN